MSAAAPIPQFNEYPELKKAHFKRLAARAIELKQQLDTLEQEYGELRKAIGVELTLAEAKSVQFEGYIVGIQNGKSGGKLDKDKMAKILVSKGVEVELVESAMKRATGPVTEWTTVAIREAKRGNGTGNGNGGGGGGHEE